MFKPRRGIQSDLVPPTGFLVLQRRLSKLASLGGKNGIALCPGQSRVEKGS